jgi:hypothetical protein
MSKDLFKIIYKTYIRPKLEFAAPVWSPNYTKDIDILERTQRKATKLVHNFHLLAYEERLDILGLPTLRSRRERFDAIETYKILNNLYSCDLKHMFTLVNHNYNTRGNDYKLKKPKCKKLIRQTFFSARVVNQWNSLPNDCVAANSVTVFKCKYDNILLCSNMDS